jgi:hypothetical protein
MVCIVQQSSHRCGLVGLMTCRAGNLTKRWSGGFLTARAHNLGQAGGLVQFWKLSPGGSNLVPA